MRAIAICCTLATLLSACSSEPAPPQVSADTAQAPAPASPDESPEQVVEKFVQAANAGDQAAFETTLTEKARNGLTQGGGFDLSGESYTDYTIGASTVTGDTASVPLTVIEEGEESAMTMQLRQENGAWRVFAMAIGGGGMNITIDLEEFGDTLASMVESMGEEFAGAMQSSMENAFAGGSEEEIAEERAQFDALVPMSDEEYEAAWRNTVDYRGRTAAAAIAELAAALSLPVHTPPHEDALDQEVRADVTGLSRLEAIARIAADAGLTPVWPQPAPDEFLGAMGDALVGGVQAMLGQEPAEAVTEAEVNSEPPANALQFEAGEETQPTHFAGPFVITVADVQDNAPLPTGQLTLVVQAFGLPAPMLAMASELDEAFQLNEIVDAEGTSLFDDSTTWFNQPDISGNAWWESHQRDLVSLTRDVDHIARIAGVQRATLPLAVESLTWESPEKGDSQAAGPLTVTVQSVSDTNLALEITGPGEIVDGLTAKFRPLDSAGNDVGLFYSDLMAWQQQEALAQAQSGEPASTWEVKLVAAAKTFEYPFEIMNVPLPNAADRPETIATLDYGDQPAPISLRFVEILGPDPDFPDVRFDVSNHSNKRPTGASVDFIYLDAAGQVLEDFPHAISGPFTVDGHGILAAPGTSAPLETVAFQMPEGTADIRVEVNQVNFDDGTVWRADE